MRRLLVLLLLAAVSAASLVLDAQDPERLLRTAMNLEMVDGNLQEAIAQYRAVAASGNRVLAAQALVRMAGCYQKLGDSQARTIYEQIVRDYADQTDAVALARTRLGRGSAEVSGPRLRTVWKGKAVDLFGQVSPDGRFLTYTDWNETGNLMLHDIAAGTDRALTSKTSWSEPGNADWSTISRDGRHVAYAWDNGDQYEIRTLPLQSRGVVAPRVVLPGNDDVAFLGAFDWSPDGSSLAVGIRRKDGTGQIATLDVASGTLRVLKSTDWHGAARMFFSHDGKHLAFDLRATEADAQQDIFLIAVDGRREVAVAPHTAGEGLLGWSPDGSKLLFTSDRTGATGVWAIPVVAGSPQGAPELLRADIGPAFSLGVTNTGTVFLFKDVGTVDVLRARIDLPGSRIGSPLPFDTGFVQGVRGVADWSPGGASLAYQACGGDCIAIRSAETGQARLLRNFYTRDPRWSPDERSFITAARDRRGRNGIFRVDAATGQSTPVVLGPGFGASPQWSPDGSKIYYMSGRQGPSILERDLTSGAEREVANAPRLRAFEISRDGRSIALVVNADPSAATKVATVMVVPVRGGEPRELWRVPEPEWLSGVRGLSWTPDSHAVLVARGDAQRSALWLIPVNGQPARAIDFDQASWPGDAFKTWFSLSPDGRTLAFVRGSPAAEVWALENVLASPRAKP